MSGHDTQPSIAVSAIWFYWDSILESSIRLRMLTALSNSASSVVWGMCDKLVLAL